MNTYESNINERIANAKAMFEEVHAIKHQMYSLDYSSNRELMWELNDKQIQIEGNIKRSVRSLAKTLGFTILEKEFMNWEGILGCLEHRWNVSQAILHERDGYSMMYFA